MLTRLCKDFYGLARICGPIVALRWLSCVCLQLPRILKCRKLQPADIAMGEGPFEVNLRRYKCRFRIVGPQCISGIREMYVWDVYLRNRWLSIKPNALCWISAQHGEFHQHGFGHVPSGQSDCSRARDRSDSCVHPIGELESGSWERLTLIRGILGNPSARSDGDDSFLALNI